MHEKYNVITIIITLQQLLIGKKNQAASEIRYRYFYLLFWPTFFQCHFYLYIVSLLLTCTILKVNKLTTLELTIPMGADKPKRNELYVQPADDIRWVTYLI